MERYLPVIMISKADMRRLGIRSGNVVRVESIRRSVLLKAMRAI
ncbi:MAG: molybdopterin dinucleotide binding domain-containing protein [Candidatus Njordarchaeales archaeon]